MDAFSQVVTMSGIIRLSNGDDIKMRLENWDSSRHEDETGTEEAFSSPQKLGLRTYCFIGSMSRSILHSRVQPRSDRD